MPLAIPTIEIEVTPATRAASHAADVVRSAASLTFGIEIECNIPAEIVTSGRVRMEGNHLAQDGRAIPEFPQNLVGKQWFAKRDGSLSARSGMTAVEFVSPVMKGVAGLANVKRVVEVLNGWGATFNSSCGFHVHVGVKRPTVAEERNNPEVRAQFIDRLQVLVHTVASFEDALYACSGTKRREVSCYCRPIKENYRGFDWNAAKQSGLSAIHDRASDYGFRYHTLNLRNLIGRERPTVEFRVFETTLDSDVMIAQIRMCLAIVEKSMNAKRLPKWDAKQIGPDYNPNRVRSELIHRKGYVQMCRLVYAMGWGRTVGNARYGHVIADGLPDMANSRAALMRMADKYDAE